jgi:hypothetical protein
MRGFVNRCHRGQFCIDVVPLPQTIVFVARLILDVRCLGLLSSR